MINPQTHPPRAPRQIRQRYGPIPLVCSHRPYDLVLCSGGEVEEFVLLKVHERVAEAGEEQGGCGARDGDAVGVGVIVGAGGGERGLVWRGVRGREGTGEGGCCYRKG